MKENSKFIKAVLKAVSTPVTSAKIAYLSSALCYCFSKCLKSFPYIFPVNRRRCKYMHYLSLLVEKFASSLYQMGSSMEGKGS